MKKMLVLVPLVPSSAWAAAVPFTYNYTFATPADQALWTVTTNNDANGPGVPQYGVPDPTSVRIQPIDSSTKNTGDIRLYMTVTAPSGFTFSDLKFSGIGEGYTSHVDWADVLLSPDGNWGTSNTNPNVVYARAGSGYTEVPITADASSDALFNGLSTVYLQVRIVDALGVGNPATNSPYVRALSLTGDLNAVPEPTTLGCLSMSTLLL